MIYKFLYIDDQKYSSVEAHAQAIIGNSTDLEIILELPKPFDEQMQHLSKILEDYDGLILDWRLDEMPLSEGKRVQFRAAALAQEIRTRGAETVIKELPIILFSTYTKLSNSYYGDNTSHDLFDRRYNKDEVNEKGLTFQKELITLAEGYRIINESRSQNANSRIEKLLGININHIENLDIRFLSYFQTKTPLSSHEYARFILQQMLNRPGPLVDEALLAARLGIDIQASDDWQTLLDNFLKESKYTGVFNEVWHRWWFHLIERNWRKSLGDKIRPLSVYDAEERVQRIRDYTGLKNLVAAQPFRPSYSSKFYTICEYHKCPLDPVDGVILDETEPEPWQDRRYLSLNAALNRLGEVDDNNLLLPHPTEKKRLKFLKEAGYGT